MVCSRASVELLSSSWEEGAVFLYALLLTHLPLPASGGPLVPHYLHSASLLYLELGEMPLFCSCLHKHCPASVPWRLCLSYTLCYGEGGGMASIYSASAGHHHLHLMQTPVWWL